MPHSKLTRVQTGLTLFELLFALLLLSILLAIALPDFSDLLQQKRSDNNVRSLVTAIELARTTAITNGSLVTLCRSQSGNSCDGQWKDGILIFVDYNGNRMVDFQDRIVRHVTFPYLDGELHWRAFRNRQYLQITAQGFTLYQNGNFTVCPGSGDLRHARQLIINRSGRIRHAGDKNNDGIREDSRGRPIRC